jgi:hypothetical protein
MAKGRDNDLMKTLRDSGVRKKVARAVSDATGKASQKERDLVNRTARSLRSAADELERRAGGSKRSEAARKAARTRKRQATKRSVSARKGAQTRSRAA